MDCNSKTFKEGVKIAVKVIDQFGMEHMTVIDEPRELATI